MSDQRKSSAAVPDEPKPPSRGLVGYSQKQQVVPCIQMLEQWILNDAWTIQSDGNDGSQPSPKSGPASDTSGDSEEFTPQSIVPSKKLNVAPQLDELGQSILTGYSLKEYVRLLNIDHARAVADRLYIETDVALRKLCEYGDGAVRFDEDPYEACVKVARLAVNRRMASNQQLQHAYENSEGSPASTVSEMRRFTEYVAYLSPCIPYPDLAKVLATETSIQFVHTVPAARFIMKNSDGSKESGGTVDGRLDVDALEVSLKEDVERKTGRQTVLVIAVVGSAVFGHNDLISKLLQLRDTYGFWLHLVGLNAAALAASKPPEQLMRVLKNADSVSLPLGRWIGLRTLPLVTYIRMVDYSSSLYQREKLDALPWWIVVNHLNIEGLRKRMDTAFRTSGGVLKHLLSHPAFLLPGLGPSADLLARMEKATLMPPTVLTFKYTIKRPITHDSGEVTEEILDDDYSDSLNIWLAQGLSNDCPSLGLQLVDLSHSNLGAAIRYCPLEQQAAILVNPADYVHHFGERLRATVGILDATVRAKAHLETIVLGKYPEIQLVHLKKWAGVGGLVYLPAMFRPTEHSNPDTSGSDNPDISWSSDGEWNEEQRRQISHFNIELVHNLRSEDSAFSVGESLEGVNCVKLGMLADDQDLDDLVEMVVKVGHEIEESSQYVDTLAELVRRGIEAANDHLRKANDERLMQEGVLRQVPLVGSLLNWWSPMPKEMTARGRTFNLKTGRIFSTAELWPKQNSSITETITPSLTPHLPATASPISVQTSDSKASEEENKE